MRSTLLCEVAYCDVKKRWMTSWLTFGADIWQKQLFKENSGIVARIFSKQWINIYFPPGKMLTTWRGIARAHSCHAWKQGQLV